MFQTRTLHNILPWFELIPIFSYVKHSNMWYLIYDSCLMKSWVLFQKNEKKTPCKFAHFIHLIHSRTRQTIFGNFFMGQRQIFFRHPILSCKGNLGVSCHSRLKPEKIFCLCLSLSFTWKQHCILPDMIVHIFGNTLLISSV